MHELILERIVAHKKTEVAERKRLVAERFLEARIRENDPPLPFTAAITHDSRPVQLIAEVKQASPSKGQIRADFDPVEIATTYERHGAAAVSILTDEEFFKGRLEYVPLVREAIGLPILRKEFIIDPYQILESRAWRADAILLIVACLDAVQLRDFREMAEGLGMDVLVEVHDEKELDLAIDSGARLIGVNNRNLHTFETRLETTERLASRIPPEIPLVAESGIFTRDDVLRMGAAGAKAVLVGEALMRQQDIGAGVDALLGAPITASSETNASCE